MSVNTFAIATDPDTKKEYIYQKVDEADKNHNQNDTHKANQGRIYKVPGKAIFQRPYHHNFIFFRSKTKLISIK